MHWIPFLLANFAILFSLCESRPTNGTSLDSMTPTTPTSLPFRAKHRSPVIFVPGFGGNQVEAKLNKSTTAKFWCTKETSDFINIWKNPDSIIFFPECLTDGMKLVYDNETRKTNNSDGVVIRIPGWGDPYVIEELRPNMPGMPHSYRDIGDMLVKDLGYIRNVSLRGAPYDFRKGPSENEEYFSKLKDLVEESYVMNNNCSVTLLTHSTGGPMSLIFLQRQDQAWKDKYINSLITLGGSWGGSMSALKTLVIGHNLGVFKANETKMQELLKTLPTLGWLLPSKLFWAHDDILVRTPSKNYTLANLKEYLIDVGEPNAWEFYKDNEKYLEDFNPPGVKLHCLYGHRVRTIKELIYKNGQSMQDRPGFAYSDGDGTVSLKNLRGCKRWTGKQEQTIHLESFRGVSHMDMLTDEDVLNYIRNVLQ